MTPDAAGLDKPPVKRTALLTGSVEYDTNGNAQATAQAATGLAPEAEAILQTAGLLWLPVPLTAPAGDPLPLWGVGRSWWPVPEPFTGAVEQPWPWLP